MVEINLIAWRVRQQEYQQKVLRRLLAIGAGSGIALFLLHDVYMRLQVAGIQHDIDVLQVEVQTVPVEADKDGHDESRVISPDKIMQGLGSMRDDGICLIQLQYQNQEWELSGYANSASGLSLLWQNTALAKLFSNIQMNHVGQKNDAHLVSFDLNARI